MMTTTWRSPAAQACTPRSGRNTSGWARRSLALAALCVVPLCLVVAPWPASASGMHPVRLHHAAAAQSAGSQETHGSSASRRAEGNQAASRAGRASRGGRAGTKASGKASGTARNAAKEAARDAKTSGPVTGKTHAKGRRRKDREPEIEDDPITMYRAHGTAPSRGKARATREAAAREPLPRGRRGERVAGPVHGEPLPMETREYRVAKSQRRPGPRDDRKSATQEREQAQANRESRPTAPAARAPQSVMLRPAERELESPAASDRGLSVADFTHAAGLPTTAQPPRVVGSRGFATGESHPDDDERQPVRPGPAGFSSDESAQPGTGQPGTGQPGAEQPAASAVRTAPRGLAEVSSNEAPVTQSPRRQQVVSGFGAEMEVLPANEAATQSAAIAAALTERPPLRSMTEEAIQPMVLPLYTRGGQLIVPPPLKGSREILVHQNIMADNAGLDRIRDDADLNRMRAAHLLVSFPEIASLEVNEGLPENRRYARPWTVKFAEDMSRAFYAQFREPLVVTSAVRTVAYQLRLQRTNGNAAAVDGEGASPHLTGQAIDFGKRGMSVAQIAWMRTYLLPFIQSGKVDVEEEFQQACFHVSVYGSYTAKRHTEVAKNRD